MFLKNNKSFILSRKLSLPSNTQQGEDFFVWKRQERSGKAVASSTCIRWTSDVDCCFNDAFNEVIRSANHLRSYWPCVFNMRRAPALSFPFPLSTAWFLRLSPPTGGSCSQWGLLKKVHVESGPVLPELIGSRVKQSHFLGSLPGKPLQAFRER